MKPQWKVIKAISEQWGEQPGPVTPIAVEVKAPTITHELTLKQIQQWLESVCVSPKDRLTKDRLRQRLWGDKNGYSP